MLCHLTVKKNFRNFWLICSLLLPGIPSLAQEDSTQQKPETSVVLDKPRKATILSAVFPGAGQIYNKSYWKVPIIYAGFGALGYAFTFNQGEYKRFGEFYRLETDDDDNTGSTFPGTPEQLRQKRNYYKKYRDLSVIGMFGLYALQILDAHVDAHLKGFDVSDDLSLRWGPTFIPVVHNKMALSSGLSLKLVF